MKRIYIRVSYFYDVPRCLEFERQDGTFFRLFQSFNRYFMKSGSETEIYYLMEQFGESKFIYDDMYIDSIEDDELGGTADYLNSLEFDIPDGQDFDDTIWELRWDPHIDSTIVNVTVIEKTIFNKWTKFAHIDHMKNYLGGIM